MDRVRQLAVETSDVAEFSTRCLQEWDVVEEALLTRGWSRFTIDLMKIEVDLPTREHI